MLDIFEQYDNMMGKIEELQDIIDNSDNFGLEFNMGIVKGNSKYDCGISVEADIDGECASMEGEAYNASSIETAISGALAAACINDDGDDDVDYDDIHALVAENIRLKEELKKTTEILDEIAEERSEYRLLCNNILDTIEDVIEDYSMDLDALQMQL